MKVTKFSFFYSNLYGTSHIIDSRLQTFIRFVIESTTANNPGGAFDADILLLTTAYTAYFGNYELKNISLAERKGSTLTLNQATRIFADAVRSKYSLITSIYPIGTGIYAEFFPEGLSEFGNLTRGNILVVSHRMTVKSNQYKSSLGGAPFAALFATCETNITATLTVQTQRKVKVQTVTGDVITSRTPVENALMTVMYSVGKQFCPDFVKCNSYYDFSLLYGTNTNPATVKSGEVAANSTMVCVSELIYPDSIFTLKNKSDLPQTFFGAHVVNGVMVGIAIEVPPQSTHIAPFDEFGAADMLFIYVKNDTDFAAKWEVRID